MPIMSYLLRIITLVMLMLFGLEQGVLIHFLNSFWPFFSGNIVVLYQLLCLLFLRCFPAVDIQA